MWLRLFFRTLVLVLFAQGVCAADSEIGFTQKDFARMLISEFGWDGGLPQEPKDRDYLVILGGKRHFIFEAENSYNPDTDNLTTRDFPLYGPFSGKSWLMGISQPSVAHLTLFVPLGGEYTVKGKVKGEGFILKTGSTTLSGGAAAPELTEIEFGRVTIAPGVQKIDVTIPPEGGLDYVVLTAADNAPVQPFDGWRFKEPLTGLRMAEVGISLSGLQNLLPADSENPPIEISAVDGALPASDVTPTAANFLGQFRSRAWLRANPRGSLLTIPLQIFKAGFYSIRARLIGEHFQGSINATSFSVTGKPYFDNIELGVFRLEAGDNTFRIQLPPMGGIDTLQLARKNSDPTRVTALAEVSGSPDHLVTAEEATTYLKRLRGKPPVRK